MLPTENVTHRLLHTRDWTCIFLINWREVYNNKEYFEYIHILIMTYFRIYLMAELYLKDIIFLMLLKNPQIKVPRQSFNRLMNYFTLQRNTRIEHF